MVEEFNEKIGVMGPNIVYKDGEIYYTRVRGFHTPLPKTADKVAIDVSLIQGKGGSGFGGCQQSPLSRHSHSQVYSLYVNMHAYSRPQWINIYTHS